MANDRLGKYGTLFLIRNVFLDYGYQVSYDDQRLYFLRRGNKFINLSLVVDDMAFCTNGREMLNQLKILLQERFKVKLLGV